MLLLVQQPPRNVCAECMRSLLSHAHGIGVQRSVQSVREITFCAQPVREGRGWRGLPVSYAATGGGAAGHGACSNSPGGAAGLLHGDAATPLIQATSTECMRAYADVEIASPSPPPAQCPPAEKGPRLSATSECSASGAGLARVCRRTRLQVAALTGKKYDQPRIVSESERGYAGRRGQDFGGAQLRRPGARRAQARAVPGTAPSSRPALWRGCGALRAAAVPCCRPPRHGIVSRGAGRGRVLHEPALQALRLRGSVRLRTTCRVFASSLTVVRGFLKLGNTCGKDRPARTPGPWRQRVVGGPGVWQAASQGDAGQSAGVRSRPMRIIIG